MPPDPAPDTTCGSLLKELQEIWDEIGESDREKDKMLLELEHECLNVYRRMVDQASKYRASLNQALAESEAEANCIISSLGEQSFTSRATKMNTLKEQVCEMKPVLEALRRKKEERIKEFSNIQLQIGRLCDEIEGNILLGNSIVPQVDESDLTLKRLGEMKVQLIELQKEKALRLQKVNHLIESIHELSMVLVFDFNKLMTEFHPGVVDFLDLHSTSISNENIGSLGTIINFLTQEKRKRLQKIQDLGSTLMEMWNLMNIPVNEQRRFYHVTHLISTSFEEVSEQGCLALDVIEQAEAEVGRLNVLKVSKMKELVLNKQCELEEIYKKAHVNFDRHEAERLLNSIDAGKSDLSELLSCMDDRIAKAKEEAISRKEILDKVEKWKYAAEEESWLDNYERDQNRYNAGKGAHINLKHAEKARILVIKIPSIVENLTGKVKAWEEEKGMSFMYDKERLLKTLEEYVVLRQDREIEKRRIREQKRLQEQLATEQEVLYGSTRPSMTKKPLCTSTCSNIGGTPTNWRTKTSLGPQHLSASGKERKDPGRRAAIIPINYVALAKDDSLPCHTLMAPSP